MKRKSLIVVLCIALLALGACSENESTADAKPKKKLIMAGWSILRAGMLPDHITRVAENNDYFDGVKVILEMDGPAKAKVDAGQPHWQSHLSANCMSREAITWENVQSGTQALAKAAKKAPEVEIFLNLWMSPGDVEWFDDAGWKNTLHNASILGRVIREGGCKGTFFDIESYHNTHFFHRSRLDLKKHTFQKYVQQVRKRGRQWMEAFGKTAPPDVVIIYTWAHSIQAYRQWQDADGNPDWANPIPLEKTKESRGVGTMMTPFIDGMLEAAGPDVQFYDGCESAYGCKTREDIQLRRNMIDQGWRYSLVPGLYRKRMKASFGIMMDRYHPQKGWHPDSPDKNHYTPEELAMVLHHALDLSDGYVWVWSEMPRFFKEPPEKISEIYIQAFREAHKDKPYNKDPMKDQK